MDPPNPDANPTCIAVPTAQNSKASTAMIVEVRPRLAPRKTAYFLPKDH